MSDIWLAVVAAIPVLSRHLTFFAIEQECVSRKAVFLRNPCSGPVWTMSQIFDGFIMLTSTLLTAPAFMTTLGEYFFQVRLFVIVYCPEYTQNTVIVSSKPHKYNVSKAVYRAHQPNLLIPLRYITLVNTNGINPYDGLLIPFLQPLEEGPKGRAHMQ